VVLVFHHGNERRALDRAAFPQDRPEVIVFALVMGGQSLAHQGDVVGHQRGPRAVPARDRLDQARHQPELAAEHRVHHEHVTCVGMGLQCHGLPFLWMAFSLSPSSA
jgi:hypothetical protein